MSNVTQVIKELKLNVEGIPKDKIKQATKEAADVLLNEIIRYIDGGNSPVQGEKKFKRLEPDYAKREKGGVQLPNLQLEGDLLEALKARPKPNGVIEVGVKGDQAPKADGHNQLSQEAKQWAAKTGFPKRRFIPDETQTFKRSIMAKINSVLDDYRVEEKEPETIEDFLDVTDYFATTSKQVVEPQQKVEVTTSNFLDNGAIEDLIEDILRRRQRVLLTSL